MRTGKAHCWQQCIIVGGLLALLAPGWAQTRLPNEVVLNGITLNSTFIEVLARRGLPHTIGPSVTGLSSVAALLRPSDPKPAMFGIPGTVGMPGMGPLGAIPGMPGATAQPKKNPGPFMVWRYDGNGKTPDAKANITTYVFFNEQGVVAAVVVNLNNKEANPDIRTEGGVSFGTKLSDIVKKYDWPEPFSRVGPLYLCIYPVYNVTYALDTSSRKVVCISIGMPFALTTQTFVEASTASVVPSTPPGPQIMLPPMTGVFPGIPGMSPGSSPGRYPGMTDEQWEKLQRGENPWEE